MPRPRAYRYIYSTGKPEISRNRRLEANRSPKPCIGGTCKKPCMPVLPKPKRTRSLSNVSRRDLRLLVQSTRFRNALSVNEHSVLGRVHVDFSNSTSTYIVFMDLFFKFLNTKNTVEKTTITTIIRKKKKLNKGVCIEKSKFLLYSFID